MSIELVDVGTGYTHRRTRSVVGSGLSALARAGELTVLLGPNGSGKSTLLRTLCGLQPALAGSIRIGADDLGSLAADEVARRVAVVLTERIDPGLLSARELVGLGRTPHLGLGGRMRTRDHEVVARALDAVGATALADRPAADLSDGERQRVLTARALAQEPTLLVLDEPTAFLDVPSRVELVELLRRLAREEGLTVLMSTHDLELALRVADWVWLLPGAADARLVSGTPEELALSGDLGAAFDRGALRFDPASGVFVLAPVAGRRVLVHAPPEARGPLGRLLVREGCTVVETAPPGDRPVDDGPVDLEVRWTADGGTVSWPGGSTAVADLGALARAVRTAPG